MGTNDIRIRCLKVKIQHIENVAKFMKDELWHLQMDIIALKEEIKGLEYDEKSIDDNNTNADM